MLCFLPTGYGKTFCFVLPTLISIEKAPMTIVISPLIIRLMTDIGNKLCYERVRAITPPSLLICDFLYLSNTCVFDHAHGHAQSLPFWICIYRLQQQKFCVIVIGLHRLPFDFYSPSSDIFHSLILCICCLSW